MMLTDEGAAMRCVLAPAGYGKTTMLHTAAQAATADGRPVVAVATTAKAVAELAGAGLDARTIARLRIDLTDGPLAAGTVVVLDEISQTPTREVEAVLAAVDACPGGSIWILGDPRQSQPVGAGGMADHIETLATSGRIPSAQLTVNRRQVDPTDRQALEPAPPGPGHLVAGVAGRAGLGARARPPGRSPPGHGLRGMRRHCHLRRRAGGGAGGVAHGRRGPRRSNPGLPGRQRRDRRADHDRAGMDHRP